jgi:hypothetical protein
MQQLPNASGTMPYEYLSRREDGDLIVEQHHGDEKLEYLFCGEKLQAHRGEGTSMNAFAWKIFSTM